MDTIMKLMKIYETDEKKNENDNQINEQLRKAHTKKKINK